MDLKQGEVTIIRGDIDLPGVKYDVAADVWTIEGIRFSGFLLREMAAGSVQTGTPFEFVRFDGDTIQLRKHACAKCQACALTQE